MQTAFDRRRINGPEDSFPPVWDAGDDDKASTSTRATRALGDTRSIFLKTGLTSQANGSAYIETGNAKVVCAVYGPRQTKNAPYNEKGKLRVDVKFAPFSSRRRLTPNKDAEDRPIGMLVHQAILPSIRLELFPKSSIDVFITVLECDGVENCVASSTIAASAALANARIEMLGIVAACSVCIPEDGSELLVDPTESESGLARGSLTLACIPALGTMTGLWQRGCMSIDQSTQCIEVCEKRAEDIHAVLVQALRDSER